MAFVLQGINSSEEFEEFFHTGNLLGQGVFGNVYQVVDNVNDKTVAVVKEISLTQLNRDCWDYNRREARILKCLDHNHITKIYSSFETPSKKIVTIMEICDSDLEKELKNRISPFSDEHVLQWSAQLISATVYLAKMNVIHRDLKPANILISRENLKITDFNTSKFVDRNTQLSRTIAGTVTFMSPQLRCGMPYSIKTDVWSLGIVIFNMATLCLPEFGEKWQVANANLLEITSLKEILVEKMIIEHEDHRISIGELKNEDILHDYMENVDKIDQNLKYQRNLTELGERFQNKIRNVATIEKQILFWEAVKNNDLQSCRQLYQLVDVDAKDKDNFGRTALIKACSCGSSEEMVKWLVKKGSNCNARDNFLQTPLLIAIFSKHYQLALLLLDNGADPNIPDERFLTPLMLAVLNNEVEVVRKLLLSGAAATINVHDMDGYGLTALHLSTKNNVNVEIIELLVHAGADVNLLDNEGKKAIDLLPKGPQYNCKKQLFEGKRICNFNLNFNLNCR